MATPYLVYQLMPTDGLRKLRSKKVLLINKIANINSWYGKRDIARLNDQIVAIDAELECRKLQMKLPLE